MVGIGHQAVLKKMFEEADASKVEAKAIKKLNDLMDLRNKIAHPSTDIEWPSIEILNDYIEFLRFFARSLVQLVDMYEVTLCVKETATVQSPVVLVTPTQGAV